MPKRGPNMNNSMGSFSGSIGGGRKPINSNMNNRNRSFGGKNNFGGNMGAQVNPWLSQSLNNPLSGLGRGIDSDQQAQLALASTLLNNLLKPASQLNKLQPTPPSLLSLNRAVPNSTSSFGGSPHNFNRDRFSFGRQNVGKVQKDYRKGDFKNKRFGDRKNKKPNQPNKNIEKKATEKKDVVKEANKVDTMDIDQSASEKNGETVSATEKSTTEPSTQNESSNQDGSEKTKKDEPKVNYSGIPPALLFCHICRKHMWDDSSFEKHLEGRPHKVMVEELDQSYKLKVDLLRHEMRVTEQQRENDIQRAQRKGKSNLKMQKRDFCTMCDLNFLGTLPAHRKNERHQRLKKFLHPKCNICSKEFYTRLEWDDHKLTPAHLKKLAEIRKETRPDLEDTEFDIIDFIEDIDDEFDLENIELKVVGIRESSDELQKEKGEAVTNGTDEKDDTNEEKTEEDEEFKKLPKYTPGVPVGENFVVEKTGSLCRACNKFCLTSEDAKTHCQSVAHYNNIIKILKAQNKIVRKRRLNDTKTEDGATENDSKRSKSAEEEINDEKSVSPEKQVVAKSESQVDEQQVEDAYDPENPGSENEKDAEGENAMKQTITDEASPVSLKNQPQVMVHDVNDVADEKQATPADPPKDAKKPRGQTAIRGGPRARRGRRH